MADFSSLSPDDWTSYVTNAYNTYLGRAPDDPSLQSWAQTKDPNALISTLLGSQEAKAHELPLMYQSAVGRAPDQAGLDYYMNSNLSLDQISDLLGSSPESQGYFNSLQTPATGFSTDGVPAWKQLSFDGGGAGNQASALYDLYTRYFEAKGAANPSLAASHLIGGFGVESPGLDPTQKQWGGGPGRGIGQWEAGGRFDTVDPGNGALGLTQFAQQNGYDPLSLEAQARFPLYELESNRTFSKARQELLTAKDPLSAARGALDYERPGGYSVGGPLNAANGYKDRMANAAAIQSMAGMGPPTQQQMTDWFKMQSGLNPKTGTNRVPTPTPRSPYDLDTTPMVSMVDPRMDLVNAGINNVNPAGFTAIPTQYTTIGGYNGLNSSLINAGYDGSGGGYSSGVAPGVTPGGGAQGLGQAAGGGTNLNPNGFTSGYGWGNGGNNTIYVPY